MKAIFFLALVLLAAGPVWAQEGQNTVEIVARMQANLDLSPEQVADITPVIDKYALQFKALEQSIDDGTINPSAIESQRRGIEDSETQDLSQYLKPFQLARWRQMQAEMSEAQNVDIDLADDQDGSGQSNTEDDTYTNLPRH